ncbi:MAG TPA: peptidase S8 [Chitinophagaceae bacterium]|nr:peptidase S8 [Chitinophagaceae bacterium]
MKSILTLLCFLAFYQTEAQYTKYIVKLKDKGSNPFSLGNPSAYLGPRALERRARHQVGIDSLDLPVTPRYIDSIRQSGNVRILSVSKWLNQVAIETTDNAALIKINSFPFVVATDPIAARELPTGSRQKFNAETLPATNGQVQTQQRLNGYYQYGRSEAQVRIHNGDFLHNLGFRGDQMQVAMLDGGFLNYLTLPTFDSVRNENRILGTWDFVEQEESVNEDHPHGMQCFSTIAANMPGSFVGTAPKASFYLFRTEDTRSEYPIEEQYWAAGAEKADSLGVDICSTSLGYYEFDNPFFNYTYAQMNGQTSISARAANIASSRGMLMVVAAGNEGNGPWRFVITPGDADQVLTVGAVDSTGRVANFSSYGPNSDGQVKPDVAAVGWLAIVANSFNGMPGFNNGTSFACPNMAGIATCLWQAFPEARNQQIMDVLRASANRFTQPDDRSGYGIPDAKKAFVMLQRAGYSNRSSINPCTYQFDFSIKASNGMRILLERKMETDTTFIVLDELQGVGNWGMQTFNYTDNLEGRTASSIRYRLTMQIGADTSYVLDSLTVNFGGCLSNLADDMVINPNPFGAELTIQTFSKEATDVTLVIHNSAGQHVQTIRYNQSPGWKTQRINSSRMAKGVYFVTAYFNNRKIKTRKAIR